MNQAFGLGRQPAEDLKELKSRVDHDIGLKPAKSPVLMNPLQTERPDQLLPHYLESKAFEVFRLRNHGDDRMVRRLRIDRDAP